jgi:hypothetical protein
MSKTETRSAYPAIGADDEADLAYYGLVKVAELALTDKDVFQITVTDLETTRKERTIYAIVIDKRIVRIGSSKAQLRLRLREWERLVTNRLQNPEAKSATPLWEALEWKRLLNTHGGGAFYARQGTEVRTPIGEFRAYLDEESILIGRYLPLLNRSKHR